MLQFNACIYFFVFIFINNGVCTGVYIYQIAKNVKKSQILFDHKIEVWIFLQCFIQISL